MKHVIGRRMFVGSVGLLAAFGTVSKLVAADAKHREIMIVSGWQSANIGDIAHTIGMIRTFQRFLPSVGITIWKVKPDEIVENMIARNFPNVKIITTRITKNGFSDSDFERAAERCCALIHASGPSLIARRYIQAWRKATSKPYGVFGITIEKIDDQLRDIVENSAFFFTRETASLEKLRGFGIKNPNCAFVPDATFSFDIRDDRKASEFFANVSPKLPAGKFVCFIPRLRYTPYWKEGRNYPREEIERREKVNSLCWERDKPKLLAAMESVLQRPDFNVLLCPEMTYQVEMCKELYGVLAPKYGGRVARRGYWLPDEAASVYSKAAAVVSFECHSPILALRAGTPVIYLRQPEDTVKGRMYYDLGLSKWVLEVDKSESPKVVATLAEILNKPEWAESYAKASIKAADALFKFGTGKAADICKLQCGSI